MKLVYQWLGAEIVFVHVGHGLLGLFVVGILLLNLPWWFMLAITPLILFSIGGWFAEARLVMPVARRYLSGDPFPGAKAMTAAARGITPARRQPHPHTETPDPEP